MARRGRRKKAGNPLSKWGYPTSKELRRQATQIANYSVPTVKSVSRPYKQQQQSVSGWLDAVLGALNTSSGQAQAAYTTANQQQAAIDQAAQARLAGLGLGQYSAGVQATQGALGDSAAANLVARGAASGEYSSRQPGIATGYANVQHNTVSKALDAALAQRMDERRAAYGQAIQTVQQNALAQANFLAGRSDAARSFGLQRRGQDIQVSQFNSQQGEQIREFNITRSDQLDQFNRQLKQSNSQFRSQIIAQYGFDPKTGKFMKGSGSASDTSGLTPNEILTKQGQAYDWVRDQMPKNNWNYSQTLKNATAKYGPTIGKAAAMSVFFNPPPGFPEPRWQDYQNGKKNSVYKADHAQWRANANLYQMHLRWFNQLLMEQYNSTKKPPRGGLSLGTRH